MAFQGRLPLTALWMRHSAEVADWLTDILAAKEICDPAEIVISTWESEFIRQGVAESLSSFESKVLRLYMDGRSYQEIAETLGRHAKSVDNALQRVKRKTEAQISRARFC